MNGARAAWFGLLLLPACWLPVAVPEPAFELKVDSLSAVAEAAGLQWVNSNADKVRQVQEAIANAPKPVHVPRQRKPAPVLDEGPLVLVETRRDLSQVRLPFETQPPQ